MFCLIVCIIGIYIFKLYVSIILWIFVVFLFICLLWVKGIRLFVNVINFLIVVILFNFDFVNNSFFNVLFWM